MMAGWRALAPLAVGAALVTAVGVEGQTLRPLTVDDVIALQSINDVALSPNGDWLAVTIKRSGGPVDPANADVWVVPVHGGKPRNITATSGQQMRWRTPIWSPNGARLLMLASTGDSTMTPYVWTMHTSSLSRVTDRNVYVGTRFNDAGQPMAWLDSVTVLCPVWQQGVPLSSIWGADATTELMAPRAWARTREGNAPAVSVIESGRQIPASERPQGQLLRIDVRTGASRLVATGYFWQIVLSPSKHVAALIADAGRIPPQEGRRLEYIRHFFGSMRRTRLAIARLDSDMPARWIASIRDPAISENDGVPHSWSPDETTLAVVAKSDSSDEYAAAAYVVSAHGDTVRQLSDKSLQVVRTTWAGNGTVLALARRTGVIGPHADTARKDWWSLTKSGEHTLGDGSNITAKAPGEFTFAAMADTSTLLGVTDGRLAAIDILSGTLHPLSDGAAVDHIIWPTASDSNDGARDGFVVDGTDGALYRVPAKRQESHVALQPIPQPSGDATLIAVDPIHNVFVFTAAERTGTFLWVGEGASPHFEKKFSLNEQLASIADSKHLLISYVGADGDSLKALLILPIQYTAGRRYPLVAWVYGGLIITDTSFYGAFDKQTVTALNMNLLTANGYALLVPSIPLRPDGQASDPMIDIPKGVIAAVDEAIRIGVADPARLGIIGQSYGGYTTYSLVAYTNRFKAAVAMAGPSDLVSLYGVLDPQTRYTDFGYEMQHLPGMMESGQFRMGADPWSNLWRYLRNSPYYFADRVETPVMIIQGDIDYVNMEQGEEFFSALYRMGKRAKFVRYWGEGHGVQRSAANVRDVWSQIRGWFDENLAPSSVPPAAGPSALNSDHH